MDTMSSGILEDRPENEEVNRLGGSANLGCVDLNPTTAPAPATVALRREDCLGWNPPSPMRMHHRNSCAVRLTSGGETLCWAETLFKDSTCRPETLWAT